MARQLVSTLAGEFDPEKYHDEYREEVLALIERKAAGEEIVAPAAPEEPAKVLDLMAALEASLARTGAKQPAPAAAERPRSRRRRRRPRSPPPSGAGEEGRGVGEADPQVGLSRPDAARGYEAWGIATGAGRRRGKRRVRTTDTSAPAWSCSSQPQSHSAGSGPARKPVQGSKRTESVRNTMASSLSSRALIGCASWVAGPSAPVRITAV